MICSHACALRTWGSQGCTSEGYKRQKTIRTRSTTLKWQLDLPLSGSSGLSLVAASAGPPRTPRRQVSPMCSSWKLRFPHMLVVIFGELRRAVRSHPIHHFSNILSWCLPGLIQSPFWLKNVRECGDGARAASFWKFPFAPCKKKGIEIHKWRTGTPFLTTYGPYGPLIGRHSDYDWCTLRSICSICLEPYI